MTRRGGGSIELHHGRYRVRISVEGQRRTLGTFDSRAEAEAVLAGYQAELAAKRIELPGAVTLARLGAKWLDRREVHGSHASQRVRGIGEERSVWRRHVAPSPLAAMAVQSIRVSDVEAFTMWLRKRKAVAALRTKGGTQLRDTGRTISAQTQRHALRLVRQALDEAVRQELLRTNPARPVRVAAAARDVDDDEDWLRADEIDRLLACEALSRRDRTAYAAAIGLGLRLNDLKALRLEHVRLDDPSPHVLARVHKSAKWHRVPILPWLAPWLRAHVDELEAAKKVSPWAFPNRDGDRYASKRFNFGWSPKLASGRARRKGALELAGVKRAIRFHDLRGTCATHLALGTWGRVWTLHEIQRFLAHADQRTTERYVRRAQDALASAAAATTGGPGIVPELSRGDTERTAEASPEGLEIPADSGSRILQDSNLRPLAPEASALSS